MKAFVSYKSVSWIRGIVEQLEEDLDIHFIKARNGNLKRLNGRMIADRYDTIVRFGTYAGYVPAADKEYNKLEGIRNASNKLKARKVFMEESVSTPYTWSREEMMRADIEEIDLPIIGRPKSHYGGKGFYVYDSLMKLRDELRYNRHDIHYFQSYIKKDREFRVHVASGKAIIVAEKIVPEENKDGYVWNLGSRGACEEFNTLRWGEYREFIVESCIREAAKAVNALGLDYGAVDVIVKGDSVFVLEVNTAPRLEEYGISRYAEYFKWLLLNPERQEFMTNPRRYSFTHEDFERDYERFQRGELDDGI